MGKKKQKKGSRIITDKSPVLYALSQWTEVNNTEALKAWLDDKRALVNKYIKLYNVSKETGKSLEVSGSERGCLMFPSDSKINERHMAKSQASEYVSWLMQLYYGVWANKKTVIDITQEALEFINSGAKCFADERAGLNFGSFQDCVIISYPDGSGFRYCATTMRNDMFNQASSGILSENVPEGYHLAPVFLIMGYGRLSDVFICGRCMSCTTMKDLYEVNFPNIQDKDDPMVMVDGQDRDELASKGELIKVGEKPSMEKQEKLKLIFRTLFLLAYQQRILPFEYDQLDITEKVSGSPALRHVQIGGIDPEYGFCPVIEGININEFGLHPHLGFLSARSMRDFMRELRNGDLEEMKKQFVNEATFRIYLSFAFWVEHGTTFSISEKVRLALERKYLPLLGDIQWEELLSEIPMGEFLLSFPDWREGCLVSVGKLGLTLSYLDMEHDDIVTVSWADIPTMENRGLLCILAHLSVYYKTRREKAEEKLRRYPESKLDKSVEKAVETVETTAKPEIHTSYDVDLEALVLYDVTARSVQRVRDKQRIPGGGWTVVPHVRRAHVHRFWVGSGDARHLEARKIDRILVNKDKGPVLSLHHIT